jgi:chemotaxis methyl-accepting protein methylase/two-component sensor histidine kinase
VTNDNRQTASEAQNDLASLVIAIGAPTGAQNSLERLFSKLSLLPNQAVIVVAEFPKDFDEAGFRALLQRLAFELQAAEDGTPIRGQSVYLCQPGVITTVRGQAFSVRPAQEAPGERGTIDSLLVSLAESRRERSVGIVLSGTGSAGTLGVAALKDHGGLAVAERTSGKTSDELTESSSASAIADFVLDAEAIPDHIHSYAHHLRRFDERNGFDETLATASSSLVKIADILRNQTGNDFHDYNQNTLLRRVQRRMHVTRIDDMTGYIDLLRTDEDEAENLIYDLLIGATEFFRDTREFEVLRDEVLPAIREGKQSGQPIRIWVVGCATGEEAYSIAILAAEYVATLDPPPQVQIFSTDIDGRALAVARAGRYRVNIEANLSPERLARWFVREGDTYCVVNALREMCIFSRHNVIKDAPFSKLDLISCRNLLIHLNAELQNRVIPLLHYALLPGRFLFLGSSEHVSRHPTLFTPVDRGDRIFRRLETGTWLPPRLPITTNAGPALPKMRSQGAASSNVDLDRQARHIAERYAPAYPSPRNHDIDSRGLVGSERVERLEGELRATRERLQATIEELENTNEELKSSNEEYHSLNEELKSANEELETSRGNLRSVNEEITRVNRELAQRVHELTRATSDLKNFLESTQIATVFVDKEMRVMNFTPAINEIMHLVDTDVGRSILYIKSTIPIGDLFDDVRRSLRTLGAAEREIAAPDSGKRYIARVLPYRSLDDCIAGAVITFVDVTQIKRAEERQRLLLAELQHRVRNTLGVVRSIARRSANNSATVDEYAAHLDGRLSAFARTQAMVTRDPAGGVDFEYLIVEELASYNANEGEQVRIAGPPIRLQPKSAEILALAIHELATNAIKYGALSEAAGQVEVLWRIKGTEEQSLVLEWRESGGPIVQPPQRQGFGTEMLERTLSFELKAKTVLDFDAKGFRCSIVIPLTNRLALAPSKDLQ